jgi:hypothetical protein
MSNNSIITTQSNDIVVSTASTKHSYIKQAILDEVTEELSSSEILESASSRKLCPRPHGLKPDYQTTTQNKSKLIPNIITNKTTMSSKYPIADHPLIINLPIFFRSYMQKLYDIGVSEEIILQALEEYTLKYQDDNE